MGILDRLFGRPSQPALPDVNEMSIDSVWEEFQSLATHPRAGLVFDSLKTPELQDALSWLRPPTDCPVANSLLRMLVDCHRKGAWPDGAKLEMLWEPTPDDPNGEPPESSIRGLQALCSLLGFSVSLFFKPLGAPDSEYQTINVTPTLLQS